VKFSVSLKNNHDFRRLYAKGKSATSPYMVLYCRPNKLGMNRVGITVSAKLGKAVVRNRLRRRLREVYRLNEDRLSPGYDIILVARGRVKTAVFRDLETDFHALCLKLGIVR
jgi:ribonuclease P protein component